MNDLVATATVALGKNRKRPSTLQKLCKVLNGRKELSEEQTLELIGTLASRGLVQIVGDKVSYLFDTHLSSGPNKPS